VDTFLSNHPNNRNYASIVITAKLKFQHIPDSKIGALLRFTSITNIHFSCDCNCTYLVGLAVFHVILPHVQSISLLRYASFVRVVQLIKLMFIMEAAVTPNLRGPRLASQVTLHNDMEYHVVYLGQLSLDWSISMNAELFTYCIMEMWNQNRVNAELTGSCRW